MEFQNFFFTAALLSVGADVSQIRRHIEFNLTPCCIQVIWRGQQVKWYSKLFMRFDSELTLLPTPKSICSGHVQQKSELSENSHFTSCN